VEIKSRVEPQRGEIRGDEKMRIEKPRSRERKTRDGDSFSERTCEL